MKTSKHLLSLIGLLAFGAAAFGQQPFTGKIVYKRSESKPSQYDTDYDTTTVYFAKGLKITDESGTIDKNMFVVKTMIEADTIVFIAHNDAPSYFTGKKKENPMAKFIVKQDVIPTQEVQRIVGYQCKKYIVLTHTTDGYTLMAHWWMAEDLDAGRWNWTSLEGIKGCPLKKVLFEEDTRGDLLLNVKVIEAVEVTPSSTFDLEGFLKGKKVSADNIKYLKKELGR